jgi:hypothetical protein
MEFEVDINLLYLFLLQRYVVTVVNESKKCDCKSSNVIPIPVKKDKNKIFVDGTCCSFQCLLDYLDKMKFEGNIKYNYSFNILWTILPFMIDQTSQH